MIYQLLGFILFLIGCTHLFTQISNSESQISTSIQNTFNQKPWLGFFKEIWFFGRTTFVVITLIFLIFIDWKIGLIANLIFLIIVSIERIVKVNFNRNRPFSALSTVAMLQPLEPQDSSFPSGDALRVWYLALILPVAVGNSIPFFLAAILLAILVTFGRLVLGVHYLTDVLAGAGLGLLGAGTTIWIWQFFSLL